MGRNSGGGGRGSGSGGVRFRGGNITNVFGQVIGRATRPTKTERQRFNKAFSRLTNRFPSMSSRRSAYEDTFVNHMNAEGREGFLSTLER